MFSGCIGMPGVVAHEPALEHRDSLPANPSASAQGDLAKLRRTLLSKSSIVARDANLMVNLSMSPRYSTGRRSASPFAAAAAAAFQRLPSLAFQRSRSSQNAAAIAAAAQEQQQQQAEKAERRRRRKREQRRSQQQGGDDDDDDEPDFMETVFCSLSKDDEEDRSAGAAARSGSGAARWGGEVSGGDDEVEQAVAERAPSTLPDLGRERSALQWTASRKHLEESLEAAAEASQQQQEEDMLTDDERLAGRLAEFDLVAIDSLGDGNCLFRSVSQQLYNCQVYHMALRTAAVKHMRWVFRFVFGWLSLSCSQMFESAHRRDPGSFTNSTHTTHACKHIQPCAVTTRSTTAPTWGTSLRATWTRWPAAARGATS
jgi:hypothetical protein